MIGSNCKVWLEGDCRDDFSPFHFQLNSLLCLSSLFHNLLVEMLLGIIILLWIFLEFFLRFKSFLEQ